MQLQSVERRQLSENIIALTKNGPVSEWVERISMLAREAGLPLEQICWQGSPQTVVRSVIEKAENHDEVAQLQNIVREKLRDK